MESEEARCKARKRESLTRAFYNLTKYCKLSILHEIQLQRFFTPAQPLYMHWILNMDVASFVLIGGAWQCHPQIRSADSTASLRWLLSHQGLKNNEAAPVVTLSAQGILAACPHYLYRGGHPCLVFWLYLCWMCSVAFSDTYYSISPP